MAHELVQLLRQLDIIHRDPVNLKNAGASGVYVDIKKAYGYPVALSWISEDLFEAIDKTATCIAAAGYGGLPPAAEISSQHNLYLTLVRDEPKKHGTARWIDGYIPTNKDRIAVVDDVFTTG